MDAHTKKTLVLLALVLVSISRPVNSHGGHKRSDQTGSQVWGRTLREETAQEQDEVVQWREKRRPLPQAVVTSSRPPDISSSHVDGGAREIQEALRDSPGGLNTSGHHTVVTQGYEDLLSSSPYPVSLEALMESSICTPLTLCHRDQCDDNLSTTCRCDALCLRYGDCCVNYELVCQPIHQGAARPQANTANEDQAAILSEFSIFHDIRDQLQELAARTTEQPPELCPIAGLYEIMEQRPQPMDTYDTCVEYLSQWGVTYRVRMIDRCPPTVPRDVSQQEASLCGKSGPSFPLNVSVPVLVNGTPYVNAYCAFCHLGKQATLSADTTVLNASFHCGVAAATAALRLMQASGNVVSFLQANCQLFFRDDFLERLEEDKRKLDCTVGLIDSCNRSLEQDIANYTQLDVLCSRYKAQLTITIANVTRSFQNLHCALCNGVGLEDLVPGHSGVDPRTPLEGSPVPSFTILMGFTRQEDKVLLGVTRICESPQTQLLNVVSNECIEVSCSEGRRLFNNSECRSVNKGIDLPVLDEDSALWIKVYFHHQLLPYYIQTFLNVFLGNVFEYSSLSLNSNLSVSSTSPHCKTIPGDLNSNTTMFCIVLRVDPTFRHKRYLYLFLSETRGRDFISALSSQFPVHKLTLESAYSTQRSWCAPGHDFTQVNHVDLVANWTEAYELTNRELLIHESESSLKVLLAPYGVFVDFDKVQLVFSSSCSPQGSPCMRAYTCVDHSSVPCLNSPQLNVSATYDKQCSLMDTPRAVANIHASSPTASVDGVLTVVGISVSIAGLTITLVVYGTIPSLMTQPGKGLVNVSLSLLLAQILFVCSGLAADHGVVCLLVAAGQHYLWLVAFLGMTLLALDVYLTFTSQSAPPRVLLTRSFVLIWSLPLNVVAPCVILHVRGYLDYVGDNYCWISPGLVLIAGFAAPLSLLLLLNGLLFSLTLRSLNQSMNTVSAARNYSNQQRFAICLKLCSVMGFTWIFGFLSNIQVLGFMKYLFIVLGSTQGVFICFAFGLNSNSRKLIRARIIGGDKQLSKSESTARTRSELSSSMVDAECKLGNASSDMKSGTCVDLSTDMFDN